MSYRDEADALDAEILRLIRRWHETGISPSEQEFDDLATRIAAHQLRYCAAYARYCASFGITADAPPAHWWEIPPMPAAAFKETTLCTFPPESAALIFETSGTTRGRGGLHFMERAELYDAALLAAFERFMLPDGARLHYLLLVPDPRERPHSSLGYMMAAVARTYGAGTTEWYLHGDEIDIDGFLRDARAAIADGTPVCIATTAFALVHLLDALEDRAVTLRLPSGSRIMETGGFKGRSRTVSRDDLYARTAAAFGIPESAIVAEYGMTELTSQYYDDEQRIKRSPPWLRARIVGADGRRVPPGEIGMLVHVDLANRSSCLAVLTEDLAYERDGGFVLIGRESSAPLRGCSLDAEELRLRR